MKQAIQRQSPRVCAVSYLNTVPLVWGMLHGPQRGKFPLRFRLPAECADDLEQGRADVGIVPAVELLRLPLDIVRGTGIACEGPVRSILLVSKVPPARIQTLAVDTSSRTSVQLARVILAERFGAEPSVVPHRPRLAEMLAEADAGLVIGDPALLLDPAALPYHVLDLGEEWLRLSGLPMVFAVWACQREFDADALAPEFLASYRFGEERIAEIVASEAGRRDIPKDLAERYLTHNIQFLLGEREYSGLRAFLEFARALRNPREREEQRV